MGDSASVVADTGLGLKRRDNLSIVSHLRYKQRQLDFLHVNQQRDLYNFYRDRNQFEQDMTYIGLSHAGAITRNTELASKLDATLDDDSLQEVLRLKELWRANTLALIKIIPLSIPIKSRGMVFS